MLNKKNWEIAMGFILGLTSLAVTGQERKPLVHVNENYRKTIRPIFMQKCFDCHTHLGHRPWYGSMPGAKQLIDKDIRDATADIDMSQDFPFLGKGTPLDYLDVLEDAINDGSMPPWTYRIVHWDSKLTDSERVRILEWIKTSREELRLNSQ